MEATTDRKMRLQCSFSVLFGFLGFLGAVYGDSNLTSERTSQQILKGDFKPPQVFRNVNLVRNTNLDKGYVRETVNVVVENIDKLPQSEYYLPFEYDVIGKVGGLEVRDKKNAAQPKFDTETFAQAAVLSEEVSQKLAI